MTPLADPPFLFVVGSGRSGTTLLVAMLDSHPDLAIPSESGGFILQICGDPPLSATGDLRIDAFLERLLQHERFRLWDLDTAVVRTCLAEKAPKTAAQAFRAVYGCYAADYGKARYGDKTPNHVLRIPELANWSPESRFVHVIRDGRDVELALRDVAFGPGTLEGRAEYWMERVAAGRLAGLRLGGDRYIEVRYEEMLGDPDTVLRRIVGFIDLPHSPAMLDYRQAAQRQLRMSPRAEEDQSLLRPLTSKLRDWRTQMSREDRTIFEGIAGELLGDLGYELGGD